MTRPKIIAFCGFKGSGKTLASGHVVSHFGYTQRSLATSLKVACRHIFNLTLAQVTDPVEKETLDTRWGKSPRELLQFMGTEIVRGLDADVWVKSFTEYILEFPTVKWVVDDVRFPNEADAIREKGGIVIGVRRAACVPEWSAHMHDSERLMLEHWDEMIDVEIRNDDTKEQFTKSLHFLLEDYLDEK